MREFSKAGPSRSSEKEMIQEPSQSDLAAVVGLLHNNGVAVANGKAAYEALEQHRGSPLFCVALSRLFGSAVPPAPLPAGAADWAVYRQLAGLTLKNNVELAQQQLGESAIATAARSSLDVLQTGGAAVLVRTAAQIITKVTAIAGLGWWDTLGGSPGYLASLLIGGHSLMESSSPMQILGALYCVQYLLEDVPKQIGESSAVIVERVVNSVVVTHANQTVRKVAFRVACHPYELGAVLDWNVDVLSPLQVGLCNAAVHLARATSFIISSDSQDPVVATLALRAALLLIDYLDYFVPLMSGDEFQKLCVFWVSTAMACVQRPNGDRECAAAGADFLAQVADVFDRTGGEGVICGLAGVLQQGLATLLPALVEHAVMADEEVESIVETDHYSKRDASAVQVRHHGQAHIEEDQTLGEDEAALTVRRSCAACISSCCKLAPEAAFPVVLQVASVGWSHADWRRREVGLLVFGAAVDGCYALMEQSLPTVASQMTQLVTRQDEHICVVSMVMWVLGKTGSWLMTSAPSDTLSMVVQSCCSRLASESKRIQLAASTALNAIYSAGHSTGSVAKLQPLLPGVTQTIHTCLPVYHTSSLMQLCILALNILPTLRSDEEVAALVTPFRADREVRMGRFVASYTACYVQCDPAALVDKDVFQCDQVVIAGMMRCPQAGAALPALQLWADLMADVAVRKVFDDADLIYQAMYTVCNYLKVCDTASLTSWNRSTGSALASSTCRILFEAKHAIVRSAGLMLLFNLVDLLAGESLPEPSVPMCLQMAGRFAEEAESPDAYSDAARLAVAILTAFPGQVEASLGAVQAVAQKLRSDAFDSSLLYYASTAFQLCKGMRAVPRLAAVVPLCVVLDLLRQSPNDDAKASATVGLAHGLAAGAAAGQASALMSPDVVHEILRLGFSWQQSAKDFEGVFDALGSMLHGAKAVGLQTMSAVLQGLPDDFRRQFLETYQLQ